MHSHLRWLSEHGEVVGLPSGSSASYAQLRTAGQAQRRGQAKFFFGCERLPGSRLKSLATEDPGATCFDEPGGVRRSRTARPLAPAAPRTCVSSPALGSEAAEQRPPVSHCRQPAPVQQQRARGQNPAGNDAGPLTSVATPGPRLRSGGAETAAIAHSPAAPMSASCKVDDDAHRQHQATCNLFCHIVCPCVCHLCSHLR